MKLTCIVCPRGCALTVEKVGDEIKVSGNECKRGIKYATAELTCPKRTLTTSVWVEGGSIPLVSVRTKKEIEKSKLDEALEIIKTLKVSAPINVGDVILPNIADTGIDLIATRKVKKI